MAIRKIYLSAPFSPAIDMVYKYEGGYQKQPQDTGNYYNGVLIGTNLGITPNAYKAFYNTEPTEAIIKGLTKSKASPIYKANYWNKIQGDKINNSSVANLMLDSIVQSGVGQLKSFRQLMNETAGKNIVKLSSAPFSDAEVNLLNALPQDRYFNKLKNYRTLFYKALVQKKPTNSVYLNGWLNRLNKHSYSGAHSSSKALKVAGLAALFAGGAYLGYKVSSKIRK
jgi:lysozyme family protein